jgi:hypothetical protein
MLVVEPGAVVQVAAPGGLPAGRELAGVGAGGGVVADGLSGPVGQLAGGGQGAGAGVGEGGGDGAGAGGDAAGQVGGDEAVAGEQGG